MCVYVKKEIAKQRKWKENYTQCIHKRYRCLKNVHLIIFLPLMRFSLAPPPLICTQLCSIACCASASVSVCLCCTRAGLLCMNGGCYCMHLLLWIYRCHNTIHVDAGYANWIWFFDWVLYLTLEWKKIFPKLPYALLGYSNVLLWIELPLLLFLLQLLTMMHL